MLIIAAVFYPEPIVSANILTQLAEELSKRYEVTVLRPKPSRPKGFNMPVADYSQFAFKVITIDSYICADSSLLGRFKESRSMGAICSNYIHKNHDNIQFIYNDSWHLFGLKTIAETAQKYSIPYITPVQDIYPESLLSKLPNLPLVKWMVMKILGPIDKYTLTHAAKIHTISDKMVQQLSKTRGISTDKFVVVRNWQNEESFTEYAKSHTNDITDVNRKFTFMYLGNVGPLAGIDLLFHAFSMAKLKDARLVIAGSGSAKEMLIKQAKNFADCDIEFWDVPAGMVPATQDKADIMCLPVKKGFAMSSIPSKLPAYMFSAKPIISSVDLESDTAKCIIDSECGWVVEPENAHLLSKCMKEAYMQPKERLKELGKNGFEFSIKNLSKKENLSKLVNACIAVIENHQ